jgi:hypothetical protein
MPNRRQRVPQPRVPRCPCGKFTYADELAAKFALSQLQFKQVRRKHKSHRDTNENRVYQCEHQNWHLTSQDQRSPS